MTLNTPYNGTLKWYNNHAQEFFLETVHLDMTAAYDMFLPFLPRAGSLLDLGCGSGRDSLYFKKKGFQVTAWDNSKKMVDMARELTGLSVKQARIEDLNAQEAYHGIWASASLLHTPKQALPCILQSVYNALLPEGIFFASFKHGKGSYFKKDQLFVDRMAEDTLKTMLFTHTGFHIKTLQAVPDTRPHRALEKWLYLVACKK